MRIQRLIAIWAAKLCSTACRLAGKQGVTLAGKLARKIDPDILRELSLEVREKIFVVCGTNGKTTTNNLLCSAIESEGKMADAGNCRFLRIPVTVSGQCRGAAGNFQRSR